MNKRYVFHKPPWSGYCTCGYCRNDRSNFGNYHSKWDRREAKFVIEKELEEYEADEIFVDYVYITEEEDIVYTPEEERLLEAIFGERA